MPVECDGTVVLLYDAPVVGRTAVLLVVLPDEVDLVVVAAGLLWLAVWRDGVAVVLPVVDAACLLVEVLDGAVETRVVVALLLVAVVVVVLTLLTDWDAVVLLTLLLVPRPPLVEPLLARTLSVLLNFLFPFQWSSKCDGPIG